MISMSDYREIYREHSEQYDRLLSKEDYRNNLLQAVTATADFENADVVDGIMDHTRMPKAAKCTLLTRDYLR